MKKDLIIDICIFFFLLISFSIVSIINPMMPDFDWYNYRAYNSWAFLNNRMGIDFFASNLRTCLNPLINLPEYFLMINVKSYIPAMIIGNIDISILMLFVYKIIDFIFREKSKITKILVFVFCVVYILGSPMIQIFSPIGSHCDIKIALICIIGFYIFIRNVFNEHSKKRSLFIVLCGCLFGAAMGLKYTAFVYFLTMVIMFALLYKKIPRPIYSLFLFLAGGLFAFFITGGLWMLYCYKYYHNPLFPYFNNIFKSEYSSLMSVHSTDYEHMLPKNLIEYIFYVFFSADGPNNSYGYEQGIIEYRWRLTYIFIIIIFLRNIKETCFEKLIDYGYLYSLLIFITVSYLINTAVFGTYRYIFADYSLFGIIVYIFAEFVFSGSKLKELKVCVLCIFITVFVYTTCVAYELKTVKNIYPDRIFAKQKKATVYKNRDLNFQDGSTVIVLNDLASIGIVGQNKNARYVGLALPENMFKIFEEQKEDYAIGGFFICSDYIANMNRELVLSDKTLHVLYYNDPFNLDLVKGLLETYNAEREVPRKFTNCSNANVVFLGVKKDYYEVYRCDYN